MLVGSVGCAFAKFIASAVCAFVIYCCPEYVAVGDAIAVVVVGLGCIAGVFWATNNDPFVKRGDGEVLVCGKVWAIT